MNMALKPQILEVNECPFDITVAGITLLLLLTGIVMVGSASMEVSARVYGDPLYLFFRHVIYLLVSLGIAAVALMVPIRSWQQIDWVLLLLSFALQSFLRLLAPDNLIFQPFGLVA